MFPEIPSQENTLLCKRDSPYSQFQIQLPINFFGIFLAKVHNKKACCIITIIGRVFVTRFVINAHLWFSFADIRGFIAPLEDEPEVVQPDEFGALGGQRLLKPVNELSPDELGALSSRSLLKSNDGSTLQPFHALTDNTDSDGNRLSELKRRNTMCLPHMRSAYATENVLQEPDFQPGRTLRQERDSLLKGKPAQTTGSS